MLQTRARAASQTCAAKLADMERPSFLSPPAPGARKNVRARLAARKENVSPPSPDEVAAALKARQDLAAANRENVLSARKEKAVASADPYR